MAITDASRANRDNLRKMRRFLQGRGVNERKTIVVSDAVYAADRITVPGLLDDDAVYSVINLDALVDVTGYLDVDGEKATRTVFSSNKGITFTAVQPGPGGNKIYVSAAADPEANAPLTATIGDYNTVLGITTPGNAGKIVILVNLATDSLGAALATGENDASLVLVAILNAMNVPAGGHGHIVDMVLTGDGSTDWTTQAPVALTGGESFKQGPAASILVVSDAADNSDIRYAARTPGTDGNAITVTHVAGGTLAVAVVGTAITVTYVDNVTTAQEVIDAVNASADASALVIASNMPSASDGSGVISTNSGPTALADGVDGGIKLTEDSSGVNLEVSWVSRG